MLQHCVAAHTENVEMKMTAETLKLIESFGAVRNADGTFTLTETALLHLIETAKNIGRAE